MSSVRLSLIDEPIRFAKLSPCTLNPKVLMDCWVKSVICSVCCALSPLYPNLPCHPIFKFARYLLSLSAGSVHLMWPCSAILCSLGVVVSARDRTSKLCGLRVCVCLNRNPAPPYATSAVFDFVFFFLTSFWVCHSVIVSQGGAINLAHLLAV